MKEVGSGKWSVWWFAALGLIAILAIHAVLAFGLGRAMTEKLLDREGRLKQEFLNSILAAEGTSDQLFAAPAPSPALVSFGAHVRSLPGIVRVNIYSPDGFIRHSTEPNLVGVHFGDNDELAESFAGKITSALEAAHAGDKSEHLALNMLEGEQLIEAYIPVIGNDGKVTAVVEFYRKDDWIRAMISAIERSIWMAAGLSGIVLMLVLFGALRALRPPSQQMGFAR